MYTQKDHLSFACSCFMMYVFISFCFSSSVADLDVTDTAHPGYLWFLSLKLAVIALHIHAHTPALMHIMCWAREINQMK